MNILLVLKFEFCSLVNKLASDQGGSKAHDLSVILVGACPLIEGLDFWIG